MILQCLSSEDRVIFLHTKLSALSTSLHLIAGYEKTRETIKTVLELVSEDQHHHLLSVQTTGLQETPLHLVCEFYNSAVLEVIMRLVTSEQTRYKLLQIPNFPRMILLHDAAMINATQAIRIIADSVSSHHLIHLLTIIVEDGHTYVQRTATESKQEAEKLLQDYYTTAPIDIALQQADETRK